jgi:HAD superfamily hydrolase (TIGR01509 family)
MSGGAISEEKRLGVVVQEARRHAGLTQQALCQKSGLSYSTLAKIERGAIKSPSVFTIQQITACLGISLDTLLQDVPISGSRVNKKISKSGVRFVYFDMNGCLVRFASRGFTKMAEDSGYPIDVIETIFWQFDTDVCRGVKSVAELNEALSSRLGMTVDWEQYYLDAAEPMPDVDALIKWVGENYRLGILTNSMPGFIKGLIKRGSIPNLAFDAVVDSSVVHSLKPEQSMYEKAAQAAGAEPNEILLIDDNRSNLAAAGKLGWHTMLFDSYHPEESIVEISTALQPSN